MKECLHVFVENRGLLLCRKCGLVKGSVFSGGDPSLAAHYSSCSELIHNYGLATDIGNLQPKNAAEFVRLYKLKKAQKLVKISSSGERGLVTALVQVRKMSRDMPRYIQVEAARLVRQIRKAFRGVPVEYVAGVAIYAACRAHGLGGIQLPLDMRKVIRLYMSLVRRKVIAYTYTPVKTACRNNIYLLAEKLGLTKEVAQRAVQLVETATSSTAVTGLKPQTIATAALYMASNGNGMTIKEFAKKAGISEASLRTCLNRLAKSNGIL